VKASRVKLGLTVVSLLGVLLLAVVDVDRTSPGPLSTVHGRLEKLNGRGGCSDCHGGWFSDMTDSCLECHAPIEAQLRDQKGVHGVLDGALARTCAACHGEHHGETFSIVNERSFVSAGFPDPKAFDHLRIGFEMNGRHLEIGCVECHENANVPVLAEDQHRFLGLDQDCASCHVDVHEGRMKVACAACHGQTTWDELHSFGTRRTCPSSAVTPKSPVAPATPRARRTRSRRSARARRRRAPGSAPTATSPRTAPRSSPA
jgi:hypothetical protein